MSAIQPGDVDDKHVTITRDDGLFVARHEETGVASHGETEAEALAMLAEALALHRGEAGEEIEDEEAFMRELGIDPDEVKPTHEPPEFLR